MTPQDFRINNFWDVKGTKLKVGFDVLNKLRVSDSTFEFYDQDTAELYPVRALSVKTATIIGDDSLSVKPNRDSTSAIVFQDSSGTNNILVIDTTNKLVGINCIPSYVSASNKKTLDVNGRYINFGCDQSSIHTRTDNTNKSITVTCPHYDVDEEQVTILYTSNQSTANSLFIGGNDGIHNAVTQITLVTGINTTTAVGTNRAMMNKYGKININNAGATSSAATPLDVRETIPTETVTDEYSAAITLTPTYRCGAVDTLTVVAGGTGYNPGDTLTLVASGFFEGSSCTATVATVSGTAVATVTLVTAGTGWVYNTTYTTTCSGTGTGCTLKPSVLAAATITRHNYLDIKNPTLTSSNGVTPALTDACVMRFNAAAGTHKAVDASGNGFDGYIKHNVNGTVVYSPYCLSKTTLGALRVSSLGIGTTATISDTYGDGSLIFTSTGLAFDNSSADTVLNFWATDNDGVLQWKGTEDYFEFQDDILAADAEKIQFRDTDIYINSTNDGYLDLAADTGIRLTKAPRTTTSLYRRYYHVVLGAANPGASGATWVDASANTTGGWRLTNATWLLRGQADIHADWDGASDLTFAANFMVNIDNTGGAAGDTVDLKIVAYYKGVGDTACKTQTVEVPTTVGACAQYKQFKATFTIDWDYAANVIESGDVIAVVLNLETDTSEVDDIVVTSMEFYYNTTHIGVESGDV